jgi:HAMP domain-containing protein
MLNNRSIATQFAVIFAVSVAILAGTFYFILDRVYHNQLKSQAETVADNVDAFGAWVAQYGRVWVKDNDKSYLGHMPLLQKVSTQPAPAAPPEGDALPPELAAVNFYSKNPALAQREFSEAVEKSPSHAKFRMTSHNYMNPVNKPDAFEDRALRKIRSENLTEYYEILPGTYRYARALHHKASCITCHGDVEKAPADVKTRYGVTAGYGFKEGDVAGIISVRIPTKPFFEVALSVIEPWKIALVILAFLVSYLFIRFSVVRPVQRLTAATTQISVGQEADLGVAGLNPKSRNELHQLALATERLRTSLDMAAKRLRGTKKPDAAA